MLCVAARIAIQIKIRVVGHIDNSRFIRLRFILNIDCIVVSQFHQHFTSNVSRKTFFTIFCHISQLQFLRIQLYGVIHPILEPLRTSVQAMAVVITGKLIFYTVQRKLTLIDTVSITSDACTEVGRFADIILNGIETKNYITHLSVLIGNHDRNNASAKVRDANFHIVLVAQNVEIGFLSVHFRTEITL